MHRAHPQLVMLHVSGYGGGGPASDRPGFGTLAEAMSGFAHVTGQPDGPPTLPPFFLADGIAAQSATFAVMMALYDRDLHGGSGQLIDVNLVEPLAPAVFQTSTPALQPSRHRHGPHREPPRRQCPSQRLPDGGWPVGRALQRSRNIVMRLYRAVDRPELAEDDEYVDPIRRQAHGDEIDDIVAQWISVTSAQRGHGCVRGPQMWPPLPSTTPSSCSPMTSPRPLHFCPH